MRIISQDGKCDYPYENSTLFIDYMDGRVINIVPSTGGCKGTKIATYSTEEKAVKAMEMLREAYIGMPIVMQNVDISEAGFSPFSLPSDPGISGECHFHSLCIRNPAAKPA